MKHINVEFADGGFIVCTYDTGLPRNKAVYLDAEKAADDVRQRMLEHQATFKPDRRAS